MKTAPARVTRAAASAPPILNRIRKMSAFFRKLSLKAEKNWHQNRGAKRRDSMRELDTGALSATESPGWRRVGGRRFGIVLTAASDGQCCSAASTGLGSVARGASVRPVD